VENVFRRAIGVVAAIAALAFALPTYAQSHQPGGEANLQLQTSHKSPS